jgi:hypothetical protein
MTPFCGPFVVCLWSAGDRRRRLRGGVDLDADELDRVGAHQEPVDGEGTDEPASADDHPSFRHALDRLGQGLEASGEPFAAGSP